MAPMNTLRNVPRSPTVSDTWLPTSTREKTHRPNLSAPKGRTMAVSGDSSTPEQVEVGLE